MNTETKKFWEAIAILVGTIIGVGMFAIPYVFSRAGFVMGILYLATLTVVMLAIHTLYGEIVLRTKEKHRLIGYAEIYLGKSGKYLAAITLVVGILGALLAYTIVAGTFLKIIFDPIVKFPAMTWSLAFYAVMAFLISTGYKKGAPLELGMNIIFVAALSFIIARTLPDIEAHNLLNNGSLGEFFLPYGVVLFSLTGGSAIPELRDILLGDGRLKKVIMLGTIIPAILYGLFALSIVGAFGADIAPDALSSVAARYGTAMALVAGLVGFLSVATSFAVMGLVVKRAFVYDLGFSDIPATVLVIAVPAIVLLTATQNFIAVIGFIGAVLGGIEGLLILKIHKAAQAKSGRLPEYTVSIPPPLYWCMFAIFVAGIGYEILYAFR